MKNVLKFFVPAFAAIGVFAVAKLIATPVWAQQKEPAESKAMAGPMPTPVSKVTPVQAMKAAQAKVGGKAVLAMFEFDEGHWIYGVIVVKDHLLLEVDVDPKTGKAGDSEKVTPDDEGKEFKDALTKLAATE